MKKRIFSYMLAVLFLLSTAVLATGTAVNAANPQSVRKVTVRVDKKNFTKKTYTLEIGKSKTLKITASPKKAVQSIRYKSSKPKVVSVNKKGKITAKQQGTAKIRITVTGKNKKKKSAWVKVRAVNQVTQNQTNPTPTPTPTPPAPEPTPGTSNILIAYFSRVGNTDYPDDVDATTSASIVADETERYGTTEYLARMIQQKVGGNLHRIETKETYSADFDEVVDQNHSEMQDGTLPELKDSNLGMAGYDTVFIGYPVWATDAPRAVLSFLNEYDLSGKKVIPFCTHDGYGAGSSYRTIGNACPQAELLDGLAVRASDVMAAENTVSDWLASIGIEPSQPEPEPEPEETPVKIT